MKSFLSNYGVDFRFQYPYYVRDHFYILDFYLPKKKICLEIDGYFHFTEKGRKKDLRRDKELINEGIRTVRICNSMFKDFFRVHHLLKKIGII